jgi:ribonuclease Z
MIGTSLLRKIRKLLLTLIVGMMILTPFITGFALQTDQFDSPEESAAFIPGEPLDVNEMRITFMGTSVIPRRGQASNSVFVETGNGDSFIFDMGSGVSTNYVAMGIPYSRMDKVFLTHLHADHMSDLTTLYCFGPSLDRKTPLRLFGPSGDTADDGTIAFAEALKLLTKWHVESFSFTPTGLKNGKNGYDIEATELPYMEVGGIAYNENGVKITHFPAVHDRDGSISYKLEWNGLSMVFSGDTKPNYFMIAQAKGVDVLIHEMVVPPEVWAEKNSGLKPGAQGWQQAIAYTTAVEDSSHTPQKAFGYILSQTNPRLGVATHFQVNDDTVEQAMQDIRTWYQGPVTIARDLLVINVSKDSIRQRYARVSDYSWYPTPKLYPPEQLAVPKYPSPTSQLNDELLKQVIPMSVYEGTTK